MTSFHGILDALEDVAVAIEASELRVEEIVCIERQTDNGAMHVNTLQKRAS